jgi:hypothetical protein
MLHMMRMPSGSRRPRRPERHRLELAVATGSIVLAQFSTSLPPALLERLHEAPAQLGVRQAEIAAAALDEFLARRGF